MKTSCSLFIAFRYLKSKKRHKSISFNTITSIAGVALGVMALIIVLSVMSGFHEDLHNKILGINAHLITLSFEGPIHSYSDLMTQIEELPDVTAASPFVMGQLMVSQGRRAHGVLLRGIVPSLESKTTDINKFIKHGNLQSIDTMDNAVIIGKELARNLGVSVNDEVNLISPVTEVGPLGMIPKTKKFKVSAIFEIGMYEYDSSLVLVSLKSAQDFFDLKNIATGIEVRIKDPYKADILRANLKEILGYPFFARDWMQLNKSLFSALKLEKITMFIILTLIILVASFNIVSTLIMNVIEKEQEIAILKTMGAGNSGIMMIFMFQGFLTGLIGTVLGFAGGSLACYILQTYEFIKLPADVYYLSHLPVKMNIADLLVVSLSAVTISLLSTIYPAYQAAKLNPIESLRYRG